MQEVGSLTISRDCVSLLSSCSAKLLKRIGLRILESMPVKDANTLFSPEEVNQMAEGLQQETSTVENMLGFSSDFADVIIGLWESELGQTTIVRLSEVTHTGLPRLENVDWSIVRTTDGSSSTSPPLGSHSIVMNLHTSKGQREMRMTREEAVALYEKLNEMQQRIDTMLE